MTPIERLKEAYNKLQQQTNPTSVTIQKITYDAMRTLCLDCNLVTFKEVERMEFDITNRVSETKQ